MNNAATENVFLRSTLVAILISSSSAIAASDLARLSKTAPSRTQVELGRPAALDYARNYYDDEEETTQDFIPAEEIWAKIIETAWPDSLAPFVAQFQSGKSYVAIFKKLPVWPIDMRSPDRFKRSMLAQEIANKASIGHMTVGWSCVAAQESGGETPRSEGFAAQTGEDGGQSGEMMSSGWGVNAMIATFTDGRIQNGSQIQRYFSTEYIDHVEGKRSPAPYFALVVEVPTGECESVREFVKNYVLHPAKPWKNFGMMPDPNKFEGAGCGSFAVSALSKAESLAPIFSTFWRAMPVPEETLGLRTKAFLPNNTQPFSFAKTAAQEHPIGMLSLILKNWDSGTVALNLNLVDPELTIYSFRKIAEIAARSPSSSKLSRYQLENLEKLKRVYNFPTNGSHDIAIENKDTGYQEINDSFDTGFATVSNSVERWWRNRETTSYMHVVSIPFGVGVMVETSR